MIQTDFAFRYLGDSFCEWDQRLNTLERNISPGTAFEFSVSQICLSQEFLRRLRCLNLADFEQSERPTSEFKHDVVIPLLTMQERGGYSCKEKLLDFLKCEWQLSEAEINAAASIFVSLRWLLEKQKNQNLRDKLEQACDFVQLFYDVYTLEWSDKYENIQVELDNQFTGIITRFRQETNSWVKFLIGYIIADFVIGRNLVIQAQTKRQIQNVMVEYAVLLKKWTGRVMGSIAF